MQCGRHMCSGANENNVKCMYASVSGHFIDCSEWS